MMGIGVLRWPLILYTATSWRRFWTRWLGLVWLLGLSLISLLLWGGALGLRFVGQELWGGLPLTLLLATFGIAFALPLGILLALGRRAASLPIIRA
jgi:general L-amino acid transport system permease protein